MELRESANAAAGTRTRRHSNPKAARFMMDLPLIGRGIMRSIPPGCTEHLPASKLFVAERFDRMEGCSFPSRIRTEADADRRADHQAGDSPEPREDHVHAEEQRDAVSTEHTGGDSGQSAELGEEHGLDQELFDDVVLARADRLAHADLARSLGDAD